MSCRFYFRIALAEQEARTDFLREKAKTRQLEGSKTEALPGSSQNTIAVIQQPTGHINFFKDEEEGMKYGANEEYQAEKKAEKEKYEKNIGLLTYLGQSAVESQQSKPWYFKVPDKKRKTDDDKSVKTSKKIYQEECDQKRKFDLDPMRQMTQCLEVKEKHKSKHKDKKSKKDKKHKHKNDKDGSKHREASHSGKKTIEELRAERLKREKQEKKRAEEVLAKARGENVPAKEKEVILDERQRTYNSQFNPDFVRKPKHRSHDYY